MRAGLCMALICTACLPVQAEPQPALPGMAMLLEAEQSFSAGDTARARELYRSIVAQDPNQPLAWSRLGTLYRQQGALEEALGAFAEVLRIYPNPDVAPDAAELAMVARLERTRLHVALAAKELAAARRLPASPALARPREELERAVEPALRATQRSDVPSDYRRLISREPAGAAAARDGVVVDVRYDTSAGKPDVRSTRSRVPVIRGETAK